MLVMASFFPPGPISSTGDFLAALIFSSPEMILMVLGETSSTNEPGPKMTLVRGIRRSATALAPRTSVRTQSPVLSSIWPTNGLHRFCMTGRTATIPCTSATLPIRPSSVNVSPTTKKSSSTGSFSATILVSAIGSSRSPIRRFAAIERNERVRESAKATS